MKPIFYMALGATIPFMAYELMNTKAFKDMMKKVEKMNLGKCLKDMEKPEAK